MASRKRQFAQVNSISDLPTHVFQSEKPISYEKPKQTNLNPKLQIGSTITFWPFISVKNKMYFPLLQNFMNEK